MWWQVGGKPADHVLSIEDSIGQLFELELRLEFVVQGETKDAKLIRRL